MYYLYHDFYSDKLFCNLPFFIYHWLYSLTRIFYAVDKNSLEGIAPNEATTFSEQDRISSEIEAKLSLFYQLKISISSVLNLYSH
jgi:hypothetical protein